ncbi:right-handed parallel beta-helix repeat-containing protein [Mobilicoccus sp.]|uniref:right-handed parallel beta-helix repeat-containing protein n=1 Tax=Mobilicoccus sp. TaxID=2034349 RepID=UPI0028A5E082|nr:right-handed parallel beta-helix repeat-containing protein [Mobilicoccus sp.]
MLARYPKGTVCFVPGKHFLSQPLRPSSGQTIAGLKGAVLTGAVPVDGWRPGQRPGTWETPITVASLLPLDNNAQCEDDVTNTCRIREQVFIADQQLRHVTQEKEVQPGTVYIDRHRGRIVVADNPVAQPVEMSRAPMAVDATAPDVTVTDLVVERFASPAQMGAIHLGPGVRAKRLEVRNNHGVGVKFERAAGASLVDSLVSNNGQLGVSQYESPRATIQGNEIRENNTDGFWIADWESGGIKVTWSGTTIRRNLITANRGVGIWCDIDVVDANIDGNAVIDNWTDGIRYEISGAAIIAGNLLQGNGHQAGRGLGTGIWDGGGLTINTSRDILVKGNTLVGNLNGISVQARHRGEGKLGRWVISDVKVEGNVVDISAGQATGFVAEPGLEDASASVTFSGNTYMGGGGDATWVWLDEALTREQWKISHESDLRTAPHARSAGPDFARVMTDSP